MMKNIIWTLREPIACGIFTMLGIFLPGGWGIAAFLLAIGLGGYTQTKEGLEDMIYRKHLNVELLMILSAIGACLIGSYQEGAILIFIFSLSGALENLTLDHSQKEIRSLMQLQPQEAIRQLENGTTEEVKVEDLLIGDRVIVAAGKTIPVDGRILEGVTSVEEAMVTGESIPVEKTLNSLVYGGTLNVSGPIVIEVTHNSDDILIQKIVRMVEEAEKHPSKTSQRIEMIENSYAKLVLIGVLIAVLVPVLFFNEAIQDAFYRGMILLVVASPCALIASTSPATLSAISNGAKKGILVKGGKYFEAMADIKAVLFDKTGTLTQGKMSVTDVYFIEDQQELSDILYSIEQHSTHPLAKAIVDYFKEKGAKILELGEIEERPGLGIAAYYQDKQYSLGKITYVLKEDKAILKAAARFLDEGKSLVYVSVEGHLIGVIALLDTLRQDAEDLIEWLTKEDIASVMITGDVQSTAKKIARQLELTSFIAESLPQEKADHVLALKESYGSVMMVGDGINDAPALANADIGIAMSGGSDIAMETADIILVKDSLNNIRYGLELSRRLRRIVYQNIIFALAVMITLVIMTLLNNMSLPFGVVGHEGSTILVILNSLRLLKPLTNA